MGQKNSKFVPKNNNFDPREWIEEDLIDGENLEYGKFQTLKHRNTLQLIDRYQQTFINEKDFQNYLRSYEWRNDEDFIVGAYSIQTKNNNRYCTTTYHVNIYIQHPKNRLSDFKDIPFPDTLYCMTAILQGYHKLYSYVGSFPVKEQQIYIDQFGKIKVWFNKDLSKNFPQEWQVQPLFINPDEEEYEIVREILNLIIKNTDIETQPSPSFMQFYQRCARNQKIGFEEALDLVRKYADENNEQVPSHFRAVLQVYGDNENQSDQDMNDEVQQGENIENNIFGQQNQQNDYLNLFRRNQSGFGSQQEKKTHKSRISRDSKVSEIQNLQRYESLRGTNQQNQNEAHKKDSNHINNVQQTYRLSGLSGLDQNQVKIPTYKPLNSNDNVVRISQGTNANNYSHMSYSMGMSKPNQSPIWLSLKPQQPYIPSSNNYMQLQNANSTMQGNYTPTQPYIPLGLTTGRSESSNPFLLQRQLINNNNRSIQQKQQQNSNDDGANKKYEKQLQNYFPRKELQAQQSNKRAENMKSSKLKLSSTQLKQSRTLNPLGLEMKKSQHERILKKSSNSLVSQANHQIIERRGNINTIPQQNKLQSQAFTRKNYQQIQNQQFIPQQFTTAQFIQPSSHRIQSHQQNHSSQVRSVSKSNSGHGFTIYMRSPSQNLLGNGQNYLINNQIPTLPSKIVKNNSQPYVGAQPQEHKNLFHAPPNFHNPINLPFHSSNYIQSPKSCGPNIYSRLNNQQFKNPIEQNPAKSAQKASTLLKKGQKQQKEKRNQIQTSYCTVDGNVPLDPEIITDLLLYT